MPTKIVSTQSNPAKGEINDRDLSRILEDFQDHVQVSTDFSRNIIKVDGINIPIWILKKLIDNAIYADTDGDNFKYVNIHFAMSLPNQKSCIDFTTDVSNNLTAVVNIGKKVNNAMVEWLNVGNEIITLGFRPQPNPEKLVADDNCCGNPKG